MDNSNYRNFDTIRRGLFYKEKGLLNKEDKLLLGGFYTKGLHSGYFLYSTPLNKKGLRTDLAYVGESTKGASGYFESTRYRDHNNAYAINFAQSVVQNSKSYAELSFGATSYNCPIEYRSIPGSKTVSGYTDVKILASTGIGVDANLSRNYYLNLELVHPFQHNFEGKHPQSKAKANFTLVARF